MNQTAENKKSLLKGMLIGGAIGAAASLLMAPKSGPALREDLSNALGSLSEKSMGLVSTLKERAQNAADTISIQASELSDKAMEGNQMVADTLQSVKEDMQGRS
ncbi:YtxH domain-containing protein [Brevibacillus nitrificans]|uniref:YtxH domain-containing protein n=1 Tax=Brevibacillus nitrificans TaxID=651560 RepID=A0A3M8DLE3_9BACL|nr:YtxH domain-containing protein [Brevibacillus nitrificans]RNB88844.1 YtxH domain-containing protein [Brevibacillus nitrificans]